MVDLIIIAVIGVFIYLGYRKGLVKTVFSVVSIFLSAFIATKVYPILTNIMTNSTDIENKISLVVYNNLSKLKITSLEDIPQFSNMPENIKSAISTDVMGATGQKLILQLSDYIANIILTLICIVVAYIVVSIIVSIIGNVLESIAKLPGLNSINKLGGIIAGLAKGVIIVYLVLFVIGMLPIKSFKGVAAQVKDSYIGGYIYNNNIITEQVTKLGEGA